MPGDEVVVKSLDQILRELEENRLEAARKASRLVEKEKPGFWAARIEIERKLRDLKVPGSSVERWRG
jgi:hypothetical protein